jgi:hypothetical protein
MGKNSHLHIVLETEALLKLKKEASIQGIRLSELCRQKLKGNPQLQAIELMIKSLIEILSKNGKLKPDN